MGEGGLVVDDEATEGDVTAVDVEVSAGDVAVVEDEAGTEGCLPLVDVACGTDAVDDVVADVGVLGADVVVGFFGAGIAKHFPNHFFTKAQICKILTYEYP